MQKTPWLFLLALIGFGCSSSSTSEARPAPGATATADQALAFCHATCDANATCAAGDNRAACMKQCDDVAKHPAFRGDFAVDAARCAGKKCLDYQQCIAEVTTALPPTPAFQRWCDDFAAKRATCGQKPMECPARVSSSDEELGSLTSCIAQADCSTYYQCLL
jgi:hypothetical protein